MPILLNALPAKFSITPDPNGSTKVKTPVFRSSYANVFIPQAMPGDNKEKKYSISMIFSKDKAMELKAVAQAICNAAAKKFGADPTKWPKNYKCPLRDGDEERDGSEYENSVFMNAGSKNKPGLINRQMQPILLKEGASSSEEFFSGCYAKASVSFYGYDKAGNKGVGCGLNNVLFWEIGERLDGKTEADEDFADDAEDVKVGETEAAGTDDGGDVF